MDGHFPYEFIGLGDIDGQLPYEFIGFGDMDGNFPYEFTEFWDMSTIIDDRKVAIGAVTVTIYLEACVGLIISAT